MSKQEGNALVRGKDIKGTVVVLSKTQPQQLSLFQTFLPADERYSNTIDLYDAIPKYFPKKRLKKERVEGMFLPMLKREFEFKGERFVVKITPAKLETREGERDFYPSHREELVEEALRKIASTRLNGIFLNNIAGVQFTLYELKKELKERGHDIDLRELIDSLKICNLTNISVQKDDGKAVMQSAIFPTLLIASKEEWLKNPRNTRCYVQFNPLVTHCINQLTYRQFDYIAYMTYRYRLSRWLHKRLCHNYVQAGLMNPYTIKLSTILRDSGTLEAKENYENVRRIDEALDELKEKKILLSFEKDIVRGKRNCIVDIKYTMLPTVEFIGEIKRANSRAQKLDEMLSSRSDS